MARIRQVKPEFFTSASTGALPIPARLLFIAVMCQADDDGRLAHDPTLLRTQAFPRDTDVTDADVEGWLQDMLDVGLLSWIDVVQKKSHRRERVLLVCGLREHQVINKPTPSKWMPVELWEQGHTDTEPLPDDSLPVGVGGRGRGTVEVRNGIEREFDRFWLVYPRKAGKQHARLAFAKAVKVADPAVIIAGAERYAADPNREQQFTKHASTWLNGGCWEDEPLPQRRAGGRSQVKMDEAAQLLQRAAARDAAREGKKEIGS